MTANHTYYPIDLVPEFWEWLKHMGTLGKVKIPIEIFEEINDGSNTQAQGKDLLYEWLQQPENKEALLLKDSVKLDLVQKVVSDGYAPDLTDSEIEQLGRDPFLVAHTLSDAFFRCLVTSEASKPSKKRHNRKLPDVCKSLNVNCCNPFELNRFLGFRTNWKQPETS